MSPVGETKPGHWQEVVILSVANAILTAVVAVYLLSTSLLDDKRSNW